MGSHHAPIAVQVVGRDVEQHGDVGAEVVHVVELKRAEFYDVVLVRVFGHLVGQRVANVASQSGIVARRAEDVVDEAGGGGLAVAARDANHLRRGVAASELNLADDGDADGLGFDHHGSGVGDAGAFNDFVGVEDEALGVAAFFPADAPLIKHLLVAWGDGRHVAHQHVEALLLGQHGGSSAALSGS